MECHESPDELLVLGSSLLNPAFELDDQLRITKLNDYGETYFGIPRRKVIHRPFRQMFSLLDPENSSAIDFESYLNRGFFSARVRCEINQLTRRALVAVRPNFSETTGRTILFYDEEVEAKLSGKYKVIIAEKETLIADLESAQTGLRLSVENLRNIALIFAFSVNGLMGYEITESVKGVPPLLNGGTRYAFAGLALTILLSIKRKMDLSWSVLKKSLVNSLLFSAPSVGMISYSGKFLPPEVISFSFGLMPVVSTFFGVLFFQRKPGVLQVIGLVSALAATALLVLPKFQDADYYYFALVVASISLGAIGALFSVSGGKTSYLSVLAYEQWIVGLSLLVASMISRDYMKFDLATAPESTLIAYIFLLVFATAGLQPASRYLLRSGSPAEGVSFFLSGPSIGMAVGCLAAKRLPTFTEILASLLIGVAIFLIFRGRDRAPT